MISPTPDRRSPERRALDEQIASEPHLPFPDYPPDVPTASIEVHLAALRRLEPDTVAAGSHSVDLLLNSGIEMHDSTLAGVEVVGRDVVIHLAPAYVHRWTGRPGIDPGSGWSQDVDLIIYEAVVESSPTALPCWLADGTLTIGGEAIEDLIPVPFVAEGVVRLSAITEHSEHLIVRGARVAAVPRGEPTYLDELPG